MKKIFNFGKIDYTEDGDKNNLVTVEVSLKTKKDGKKCFTASGNIWNSRQSDILSGGQNLDTIAEYIKDETFLQIFDFWKKYHLNDMHAGTPEQEKAVEVWKMAGNKYNYTEVCNYLKSINLYEVEHGGKPYKYGYGWLYEAIPADDLQAIENLLN